LLLHCIGEEIGELFEQVRVVREKGRNLLQYVLDPTLLLLVGVQDFQERLVDLRLVLESALDCCNVRNGMVKLHWRLRGFPSGCGSYCR